MIRQIIISMRPYQWVKNVLVFAALFFSLSFLKPEAILLSLGAFAAFCLVSSGIYLLNDIRDREADRLHPQKKHRPIAAGRLSPRAATLALFFLITSGLLLSIVVGRDFTLVVLLYIGLNLGYSLGLKRVVLLDVMIVAVGFLLRAVAGAFAIEVAVSPWLFICTLLLALLLVFGKRRHELAMLSDHADEHRDSLREYSLPLLEGFMFISAGAAIVTYSLYTMAEETIERFETQGLIATTPFAVYGIFRYLYLIYIKRGGGDPTRLMVKDKPFLINALLWVLLVLFILYRSKLTP